jgi:hypothetical protein
MSEENVVGDAVSGQQKNLRVNYPGNSHKSKSSDPSKPEKNIEKIITGEAIQRKKTLGSKFKEVLSGEDARSVGAYILFDVIIPAAKSMLADAATQGLERILFGDSRRSSSSTRTGYTSYNNMYKPRQSGSSSQRLELSQRARATHNFGEVVLSSRGEAEEVLDRLTALIDQYQVATVSDLYDLVGITGSFTDDKWGWFDLRGSGINRVREGYLINLPQTQPID